MLNQLFLDVRGFEGNTKEKAGSGHNKIESTQYSKLFCQELTSSLIHLFLNDIGLVPVEDGQREIPCTFLRNTGQES